MTTDNEAREQVRIARRARLTQLAEKDGTIRETLQIAEVAQEIVEILVPLSREQRMRVINAVKICAGMP